ncbi:MAG: extracellular solute-binding protein [Phycisphaerae bacterium]|nr:extracellular solute-binding protein [Phycisphaerae bacterium]
MRALANILRTGVITIMVVGTLGLVLFGPRSTAAVPPDRVVVRYWEKWTDFEGLAMQRLVGVFNDTVGAERGIYVQYESTTQIDLKSLVAIAGGDPPDLIGLWPHLIASYASKGALTPLGERATRANISRADIIPVYYDQCCYRDELYGLPLTPWSLALYYNLDIFAQKADELRAAGLDPERAPRTTDELLAYCRVLTERDEHGTLTRMGYIPGHAGNIGWYWYTWPLWFGGHLADPESGLVVANEPEWQASMCWVRDFAQTFGYDALGRFEGSLSNFNSPDNPFMIGKLAMMRQGPWFANMIRQYAPTLRYSAAPIPTVDGRPRSYVGQDILVIPTGARHAEQAWEFIAWLYTNPPINVPSGEETPREGYEYYVIRTPTGLERRPMPPLRPIEWINWIHYKGSPLNEASQDFTATHPNPVIDVHERLARLPDAQGDPPLPNWLELREAFGNAYIDIWRDGADPAQRLERLQARIVKLTDIAREGMARYGETYP